MIRRSVGSASRPVYGVKDVAYIPLDYSRATVVLNRIITRIRRSVAQPRLNSYEHDSKQAGETNSLHVKWAPQHLPTTTPDPVSILSSSPTSSGYSSPTSSGISIAPLAKTLADRLSFWKSKFNPGTDEASLIASKASGDHETLGELLDDIDNGDTTNLEPNKVIEDIMKAAAATEPESSDQKHRAMDDKVLKETVRQFTKGGMYFSYTFGMLPQLVGDFSKFLYRPFELTPTEATTSGAVEKAGCLISGS